MNTSENSMTSHIDVTTLMATVRMLSNTLKVRLSHNVTIAMVEGETDEQVYSKLFNSEYCKPLPSIGKSKAINTVRGLSKEAFEGVIAVVDSDFDLYKKKSYPLDSIILTDAHDMETLLINSPAFEEFLCSIVPEDCLQFMRSRIKAIKGQLRVVVKPLGYLRLIFSDCRANFDNLNWYNFVNGDISEIDVNKLIDEFYSKNRTCEKTEYEVLDQLCEMQEEDDADWTLICQGHDLIRALHLILKNEKEFEGQPLFEELSVDPNKILQHLANHYQSEYFLKTKMAQAIRAWEKAHSPYKVLN